tara:strand:- start:152 stop:958 length:807 start_codon:yes stop_codon:yes gene_type:complete
VNADNSNSRPAAAAGMKFTKRRPNDGRGEKLMDMLEHSPAPSGVFLVKEEDYTRGGRMWAQSLVMTIFGTVFCGIVIVVLVMAIVGGAIIALPCLLIFSIPFFMFGGPMVLGGLDTLINPEPLEEVTHKMWYDRKNKFLVLIEHCYDVEEEEEYAPEVVRELYLADTDEIKVIYDPPSDGAVSAGSSQVVLWDQNTDKESRILMFLGGFPYGERKKKALEKAREYSMLMRIQFDDKPISDYNAWNMEVANPDGGFFITRGGPGVADFD